MSCWQCTDDKPTQETSMGYTSGRVGPDEHQAGTMLQRITVSTWRVSGLHRIGETVRRRPGGNHEAADAFDEVRSAPQDLPHSWQKGYRSLYLAVKHVFLQSIPIVAIAALPQTSGTAPGFASPAKLIGANRKQRCQGTTGLPNHRAAAHLWPAQGQGACGYQHR